MDAPRPTARRRWPWIALGVAAMLVAVPTASALWLFRSTAGVALVVHAIDALLPERITATGIRGTFATGVEIDELRVEVDRTVVVLTGLRASIDSFEPLARRLALAELSAERVAVQLPPPSPQPASVPSTIAAPLTFDAHVLRIGEFTIERERPILRIDAIDAAIAFGPRGTEVRRFAADIAGNRLTVVGTLGPTRPFPIDAGGTLISRLVVGGGAEPAALDAPVQATWRALDSLERLELNAGVTGGPGYAARGALRLRVAPFAAEALQSLDADLAGIDPAAWFKGAPQADLELRAQLIPAAADTFTLSGQIQVFNRRSGPLDTGRVPLRELRGRLTAHAGALALDEARAVLARGSAAGRIALDWAQRGEAPRWDVDARLDGVDPATIHTRAQPLIVDGRLAAQSAAGATQVQTQLRTRAATGRLPVSLDAALRIDAERIALTQGRLQLDGGDAQLAGELSRRESQTFAIDGTLRDLNPGILVKGADARLNGELHAEGRLQPSLRATLSASLADSTALGRPLRGRIDARWLGDDDIRIDAELAVRSAELTVHGALGTTDGGTARNLEVTLKAPAIEELGLPLRGSIEARATLAGVWNAPAIDASAEATGIAYAGQRIGRVDAQLRYGGGTDGELEATLALRGHRHPRGDRVSVAEARLHASGTLRDHRLTVAARTADGAPIAATLAGGWQAGASEPIGSGAWRGRVESASAGGDFDASLTASAELAVGPDGGRFGPAQLLVHGARVADARLQWRSQGSEFVFESSGRFDDFALAATAAAGETPLALRGEWMLRAAQAIDARVLVERTGGDVYTGPATRRAKMGLTELRAEAQVRANRLEARAVARGSEVGAVTAALRAEIASDEGLRLAPKRPWSGEIEASVPSLAWINPFLSANLRESIRVGGSVQSRLQLGGTPDEPRVSGFVHADRLRVAWIEQGVRLDNGVVRARLASDGRNGTEVVFDSVSFSGPPRFVPDDRRVRQALGAQTDGRIEASGRVQLPALEGVVQMQFVRFPLVQRHDRWAVATGGANLVFSPKRVRLDGALIADAGYIDIDRPTVPTLSDDVVVVRAADSARGPAEPRVAFDFDFGIDLGPAFVLRGSGVDARLAGALRVRHEGRGVIRATGTVEARDGTYEGYGQKLVIERGRINFQGPIDNPGLDILALRKGLPVDVGVTITRTAANPLIRLYSDPPQADFETLSWLVLGRPAEATRGDNIALARAAVGLLGGSGEGVPAQLARRLGIDEFSIRTADSAGSGSLLPRQSVAGRVRGDSSTLGGEVVTIGKRLSDALTLSYEQATTGTTNVVQLSYRLTQRLSVIARAGTENALDLVYSFAFD